MKPTKEELELWDGRVPNEETLSAIKETDEIIAKGVAGARFSSAEEMFAAIEREIEEENRAAALESKFDIAAERIEQLDTDACNGILHGEVRHMEDGPAKL